MQVQNEVIISGYGPFAYSIIQICLENHKEMFGAIGVRNIYEYNGKICLEIEAGKTEINLAKRAAITLVEAVGTNYMNNIYGSVK